MKKPRERERAEDARVEMAPPLDAPEFLEYPSDVLHEDMCLQEALRVTGRRRRRRRSSTATSHIPQDENETMHRTTATDCVEYHVTEDFHGAQTSLLPGRRTCKEDDLAPSREEPPEEPGLGEDPRDPVAAQRDASHEVDTRDDTPYREPRGYRPEDVPGDGNCLFQSGGRQHRRCANASSTAPSRTAATCGAAVRR